MSEATTLLPGHTQYALLGTALDYRLRLYFDASFEAAVARAGASLACSPLAMELARAGWPDRMTFSAGEAPRAGRVSRRLVAEFFGELDNTVQRLAPARRALEQAHEEELARWCIVLALWEQVFRCGGRYDSLLWAPHPKKGVQELLDLAEPAWVSDLCQLSRLFFACGARLWAGSATLNPTFDGSGFVGGADADFIAGACLWDIKTSTKCGFRSEWIYQLLGYTLLDFSDEHSMREVGIYLSRQGLMLHWSLDELLGTLMMSDGEPSLVGLRAEFRRTVEELQNQHMSLRPEVMRFR